VSHRHVAVALEHVPVYWEHVAVALEHVPPVLASRG
jgi:hypothetical protein